MLRILSMYLQKYMFFIHQIKSSFQSSNQNNLFLKFAFESYLSKHKEETDCGEKAIEEFHFDESQFIYKCDKCGNTESQFATKEDLEDHIFKNHQDKESEQINYNHKFSIWLQDYLGN